MAALLVLQMLRRDDIHQNALYVGISRASTGITDYWDALANLSVKHTLRLTLPWLATSEPTNQHGQISLNGLAYLFWFYVFEHDQTRSRSTASTAKENLP